MVKSPKKLLDQVRDRIRLKHYSIRTERSYTSWIRRFILFGETRQHADVSFFSLNGPQGGPSCRFAAWSVTQSRRPCVSQSDDVRILLKCLSFFFQALIEVF